jgi:transcriptional regulator with XRE-family HTH domain
MNRNERDWPAVRTAVDARMKELGLSTAEVAHKMRMAERTLRAFLNGRTRPHGYTVRCLNDALGLPYDHLYAIAEKRKPEPLARVAGKGILAPAPVAALLSLTDLGPGAQMVADYKAYVSMVAKELTEGMTREQRSNVGSFLYDLGGAVKYG